MLWWLSLFIFCFIHFLNSLFSFIGSTIMTTISISWIISICKNQWWSRISNSNNWSFIVLVDRISIRNKKSTNIHSTALVCSKMALPHLFNKWRHYASPSQIKWHTQQNYIIWGRYLQCMFQTNKVQLATKSLNNSKYLSRVV